MTYRIILFVFCSFLFCRGVSAQWTKEDSLWIEDVKSGKVRIELTPEANKAIEEGLLLRFGKESPELRSFHHQLSILKEFDIKAEDDAHKPIDFTSLPSNIFILRDIPDNARQKSLVYVAPPKYYISMKVIPIGTSGFYITANTGDLNPLVKDGQSRGGAMGTIGYSFSMEDILRHIFWASERAKKKNRKNATAWKFY